MAKHDYSRKARFHRDESHKTSKLKVTGLILFLIILAIAIGWLYYKNQKEQGPPIDVNLCPPDRLLSELNVLLLDISDKFSEPQRLAIKNELNRIKENIKKLGLIEVYLVTESRDRVERPEFRICNPGTGADMSWAYENPALAWEKWKDFSSKLDSEIDKLISVPASPTSAIFEAVQSIALRTFNRPEFSRTPKYLYIVSDLLQNVPGKLSQYDGVLPFQDFEKFPYFSDVRADLTNVEVKVLYLIRSSAPQKWPEHYRFWEDYFKAQGANLNLIKPIYGEK